jgi:parvulin-like peptidyl-prolyl isomerase
MKRLVPALALAAALAAPARAAEPPEYSARHILVSYQGSKAPGATRTKEEAKALAEKALAEVTVPGANFAQASHTYSDDKVSDASGGFLGIFQPGSMVPQFQKAVEEMKEGDIRLVETPFGFHVVQRLALAQALAILTEQTAAFVVAMFPYKGGRDAAVVRAKDLAAEDAARAAAHLRRGKRFEDLPKEWDARPMKPGWMPLVLRRGMARPEFKAIETAAFSTKVGDVSDPVDTSIGYVVVKRVPWWRSHLQHFLVMHAGSERVPPGITRTKEEAKARAEEALKKFEADPSSWAKVVEEYSDEPGAGEREGSLGAVEPGTMVPEFDAVVSGLAAGGHSAVFESRFGWHVVRRTDKATGPLTEGGR